MTKEYDTDPQELFETEEMLKELEAEACDE